MGRQYYLHRLALGRPAYETGDAIVPTTTEEPPAHGHYVQQYDSKGNPFNPTTSAFNKSMRDAQNEALLLTGIIERKERTHRRQKIIRTASRANRLDLLDDEHWAGEFLEYVSVPLSFLSHMWLDAIIKRIQVGAYPSELSFLSILNAESKAIVQRGQSTRLSLARLFPAMGGVLSQIMLRIPLEMVIDGITAMAQNFVYSKRLRRNTSLGLRAVISLASEAFLILIELALLPLEFHTTAQALTLLPALPLFPPWSFFSPTGSNSFHAFGWKGTTVLFTSPALLLSISSLLRNDTAKENFTVCSLFTSFRWPGITDDPTLIRKPAFSQDPVGWTMYQAWSTRTICLQWAGWRIVKLNPRLTEDDDLGNDTILDENYQPIPTAPLHRSTTLAHAPARFLGSAIDSLFRRVTLLPFESLMLRSVAFAFAGPSPSPSRVRFYGPFRGPLSRTGSPAVGWAEVGAYASRLGLGILLNASIDVVLFLILARVVRSVGKGLYEWDFRQKYRKTGQRGRLHAAEAESVLN